MISESALKALQSQLDGTLSYDELSKAIYATDASVYRKLPIAVAYPKTNEDIKTLIHFASTHLTSLIPRTAGTSLAGQCVGEGIIVDVSKHFTRILDINERERTVTVQPGVVRDELNAYLKPFGLFFGPNTSTSNRCMIGGMVGNNSSGTTSIQYGVTRDKVLELQTILSDGSEVAFKALSKDEVLHKCNGDNLEGHIYNTIYKSLNADGIIEQIQNGFPKTNIHRRNTGYALDKLVESELFSDSDQPFNICQLLSGSEGTLAFTTAITLQLDELPPPLDATVVLHFESIAKCLKTVHLAMEHKLYACEMLDDTILNLTKFNKTQQANRAFIDGDPKAILMCELRSDNENDLKKQITDFNKTIQDSGLCYANPVLRGADVEKAMALRKAGLGLLGNMIGDNKAVACIEDTAVALEDLDPYIEEFSELMKNYNQKAVYYAHAGAGELHLRPILNLKSDGDVKLFRSITQDVARLVKKYSGSLSGEHGDGIVRAEFIPYMIGESNYQLLKTIKTAFDPNNILNPGKIVDAYPMDEALRYETDRVEPKIETLLDFSSSQGILREAEKCNGSGDCRKLPEFGGTMCPSYRATRDEKDTTRARANALREFLTHSEQTNRFNHKELKQVFDLCLSCKACASECPSSVDVAALKAEFQYQYQETNGYQFKDKFFANASRYNKMAAMLPKLSNAILQNKIVSPLIKGMLSIHHKRSFPKFSKPFLVERLEWNDEIQIQKEVFVFIDEFSNYLDSNIINDIEVLLSKLNYKALYINDLESGRSQISKGFLKEAKAIANTNVSALKDMVNNQSPLIGIEPSAVLTFRDEYIKLADDKEGAQSIADNTFLIEEFLQEEIRLGHITAEQFTNKSETIKFHGHCHQKALADQKASFDILNLPKNYKVTLIPSGCCGMAGSFGYEKTHYDISMAIGEQTLFPHVRKADENTLISANGTSCRHQILDGTKREALHPVTILRRALL